MATAGPWTLKLTLSSFALWATLIGAVVLVAGLAALIIRTVQRADAFKRSAFEALATSKDSQERYRAAVRQSESQFRAIFEGAAIGIALAEGDGRIIKANRAFTDLVGYGAEELCSKVFTEITHPADADMDMTLFRELMAGDRDHYKLEKRYIRKDGESVPVQLTVSHFPGDRSGDQLAIAMVEDIGERKRMEQSLLQSERLSALGKVTAIVAHDLRNPMFAMRQFVDALRARADQRDVELAHIADGIDQCITECGCIIDELLNVTRMDELRPRQVTVDEMITELLDHRRVPASVTLSIQLGLDGTTAAVDPDQFRRAFYNVMDNAAHAVSQTASPAARKAPSIEIRTRRQNGRLEVAVSDNGAGIPDEIMPSIFNPLFSTKPTGYGLGLPSVKKIMEEHGGGVEVESRPNAGTNVVLWLPLPEGSDA